MLFLLKILSFLLFVIFCFSSNISADELNGNLVWAAAVHRHGSRTPVPLYIQPFAKQFNALSKFSGQLTDTGRIIEIANGKALKARYIDTTQPLVQADPQNFTTAVYYRSTDVDRVLESAESVLEGLFPNQNPSLYVAVHTVEAAGDRLLLGSNTCPSSALHTNLTLTILQNYIHQTFGDVQDPNSLTNKLFSWADLMKFYPAIDVTNLFNWLYDNIAAAMYEPTIASNIPDWIMELYPKIHQILSLFFYHTNRLYPLTASPGITLAQEIYSAMKNVIHHANSSTHSQDPIETLRLYSAHDSTVAPLFGALNLLEVEDIWSAPPFASMMGLELRRIATNGEYWVNLWFTYPVHDGKNWNSDIKLVPIRCPNTTNVETILPYDSTIPLQFQCEFTFFEAFILSLNLQGRSPPTPSTASQYSLTDPCCYKPGNFNEFCPFSNSSLPCQNYQTFCPN